MTASDDSPFPCAWQPLWDFARREGVRLQQAPEGALDPIGLRVRNPRSRPWVRYDSTPTNSVTFASTGGDGVHFGIVSAGGAGPIVMTVPMNWDRANLIVGAHLVEFLALGCESGYFVLEQLTYRLSEAARDIEAGALRPVEEGEELLARLRATFDVHPWRSVEPRLRELQDEFASTLELAPPP